MYKELFMGFLRIGIVGYGGGPASIPLVQKEYVDNYKMITSDELIEMVGVCNMLPGPMITKIAALVGYKYKKTMGAMVALAGLVLPSTIALVIILKYFYSAISTNPDIKMMVNAVMPMITVMMFGLVINFYKKARGKFTTKALILYIALFMFIFYVLNVNVVLGVLAMILLCLFVPKGGKE